MVTLERQRERAGREGVDGKAFIAVYGSIGGSPIVFFIIFFFYATTKKWGGGGKEKTTTKKFKRYVSHSYPKR